MPAKKEKEKRGVNEGMMISPNCPCTLSRPPAVRFNYLWWRGCKAQWAGSLSMREVIRWADVFGLNMEELFCFVFAWFHISAGKRVERVTFRLYVFPDRTRISKHSLQLHETSLELPHCCSQANSVCGRYYRCTYPLKASFSYKHFKGTLLSVNSDRENDDNGGAFRTLQPHTECSVQIKHTAPQLHEMILTAFTNLIKILPPTKPPQIRALFLETVVFIQRPTN